MDLPTRTKQKKAESESYAILLYKLRHLGIFRNVTDNDYGVDFEVEIVDDDVVTGTYFKAQVKASQSITLVGEDQRPSVGGIKQSTLHYWCQLSRHTHVIAYAVDLTTETVYLSKPVFWAATQLIDGTEATKSISFMPAVKEGDLGPEVKNPQDLFVAAYSKAYARAPKALDVIYAITTALRYLPDFLEQRVDAFQYDPGTELARQEIFRSFLEVCRILLFDYAGTIALIKESRGHLFDFDYWARQWDEWGGEVVCWTARTPFNALFPPLIETLRGYRKMVMAGAYYWSNTDPQFLRLVHDTTLPETTDAETLDTWGRRYEDVSRSPDEDFSLFLHRVQAQAEADRRAFEARREARRQRKADKQAEPSET